MTSRHTPFSLLRPWSCALLSLATLAGCAGSQPAAEAGAKTPTVIDGDYITATIGFYNLENLYDTQDDPGVLDEDFTPTGVLQWDDARYRTKLGRLASAIVELGSPQGPDVLGVTEVENDRVLRDLVAEAPLASRRYQFVHFDSPDPRGIDVALLYKPDHFTPTAQRAVKMTFPDTTMGTRDVLVVDGKLHGDPITFLVCHWPSRRNGVKSDRRRYALAQQTRQIVNEKLAADPQARVLVMGDLNDSPTDSSVAHLLNAAHDRRHLAKGQLYNAFYDLHVQGKGTLYYRGRPDVFDQIILSGGFCGMNGLRYVPNSAAIYAPERLVTPETKFRGEPLRTYGGKRYIGGFSDHFPVYLTLTK